MAGSVPPRVTYWTGTWDPEKEAISKEVHLLRSLGTSTRPVVAFSSGEKLALEVRNRVLRLSAAQWPLLRLLAPVVERSGRLNHVFGGLRSSWHVMRSLGRRPTIFTVVLPGLPIDARSFEHVTYFVAEDETLLQALRAAGISEDRLRLIHPGVDLHTYSPGRRPPGEPFRVLFASSPSDPAEFDARGIPLLVETARLCGEMEFVFLWRTWGNQARAREAFDRLAPPANVKIEYLEGREMPTVYRGAHAVASFYAPGFGKSCPNSVIEGLACGVPALVADSCGIAPLIERHDAGIVTSREPSRMAQAARDLRSSHHAFAQAARALAEQAFDVRTFLASYLRLYQEAAPDVRPADESLSPAAGCETSDRSWSSACARSMASAGADVTRAAQRRRAER